MFGTGVHVHFASAAGLEMLFCQWVYHFDPDSNICNSWMYCQEFFAHALMVPKIWILITLAIPWMSFSTTNTSSYSVKYLQILMDSLAQNVLQIFMIPRGWTLLTLIISWVFPLAPRWSLHLRFPINTSWQLQDWLPWNFVQTFMVPRGWVLHESKPVTFIFHLTNWLLTCHKQHLSMVMLGCSLKQHCGMSASDFFYSIFYPFKKGKWAGVTLQSMEGYSEKKTSSLGFLSGHVLVPAD